MNRRYDLINQTESKNREGYEVPKQSTELELEHKGGYIEELKTSRYVKPRKSLEVSVDIAIILQLNTDKKREGLENVTRYEKYPAFI